MKKYIKCLYKALDEMDIPASHQLTNGGHLAFTINNRKVFVSRTPSDYRTIKNFLTQARKVYNKINS